MADVQQCVLPTVRGSSPDVPSHETEKARGPGANGTKPPRSGTARRHGPTGAGARGAGPAGRDVTAGQNDLQGRPRCHQGRAAEPPGTRRQMRPWGATGCRNHLHSLQGFLDSQRRERMRVGESVREDRRQVSVDDEQLNLTPGQRPFGVRCSLGDSALALTDNLGGDREIVGTDASA